ncbi:ParB/RepB/Spo0J family partition protein [Roseovarius sp. D22-M7]|uniref:ParB/RepB/Spo0J family partition protein n=1 Tax=Roseovarius sp. D22-M7 TaxID=3127116 RepID=UPI00300FADEF
MAKRKRLGGPLQDHLAPSDPASGGSASSAPIARIAGETSVNAAFDEVRQELDSARSEGRLVLRLPLDKIETAWLIRDRLDPGTEDDPDFAALLDSLRAHGQRSPIEVADMGDGRYGLISGWRRLTALARLHAETGEARFATVLALLRRPDSAQGAYLAMVEENEIRLGLSYYERARIAAKAVEAGVYPSTKTALQSLFATASRAKRSKIGSFLTLYETMGDFVRFPQALTERVGLSLVKIVEGNAGAQTRLRRHLEAAPAKDPEVEQTLLEAFIASETAPPVPAAPATPAAPKRAAGSTSRATTEISPGVFLDQSGGALRLSGPGVDSAFRARLEAWLRDAAQD